MDCAVCKEFAGCRVWQTQLHKTLNSCSSAKKAFFSISLIHNVLSMKTAGDCPMMMPLNWWLFGSRVKTSKHRYLCTWEVPHISEKEPYTGVRYGVAEFSALISKSSPSILPNSSQSVLRPCCCSCFPAHHTQYISLLPCLVVPVNPQLLDKVALCVPSLVECLAR